MDYLFVAILEKNDYASTLFYKFNKNGLNGTVLPTTSLKHTLLNSHVEPVPAFGGLRHVVDNEYQANTTLFVVVNEAQLALAKKLCKEVSEEIKDKVGITFALPVTFVEGLSN